jgi:ribose-phosphate pyrophosphokinase
MPRFHEARLVDAREAEDMLDSTSRNSLAVFSTDSGTAFLREVARRLGVEPAAHEERAFEDGEHKLRPLESVRGRDVYVVESLFGEPGRSVNDKLVRVLFLIATLKDAGAGRVTMVAPYLCYSRKDTRTKSRDPVTTRYVASLFEAMGTDRVLTLDVHNRAAYENAFRIPAEHLSAIPMFADIFVPLVGERDAVVISPDAGGIKRAERLRAALERRLRRPVPLAFAEKFRSEGQLRGGRVVGDVDGRVAIIVDDLISSGRTLAMAASACRERGSVAAYAAATHGVFAADAAAVLDGSALERVIVLDTVSRAREPEPALSNRLEVHSCASLVANAIDRLHVDGSLVELES